MKKIILTAAVSFTLFTAGVAHADPTGCQYVNYGGYIVMLPMLSKSVLTNALSAEGFTQQAINDFIAAIPACWLKK